MAIEITIKGIESRSSSKIILKKWDDIAELEDLLVVCLHEMPRIESKSVNKFFDDLFDITLDETKASLWTD